jgi:hypothetical protein
MVQYDPQKDRSEEFGWKKVCDEHQPTEAEQHRWGMIIIVFSAFLVAAAYFIGK